MLNGRFGQVIECCGRVSFFTNSWDACHAISDLILKNKSESSNNVAIVFLVKVTADIGLFVSVCRQ